MILGYDLRLLCLCLASFFLVSTASSIAVTLASGTLLRFAASMRAQQAARFLLGARLLPFGLGIVAVLALCVPSYLWLEPESSGERIGWIPLTVALLAAVSVLVSVARVIRTAMVSARFDSAKRQSGSEMLLPGDDAKAVTAGKDAPVFGVVVQRAVVVERDSPIFAIVGIFRPCVIVSRAVLRVLSSEQLDLALRHENAHRISRDNLKRLLLLLARTPLPFFRGLAALEKGWAKYAEWAADDEAVRGDANRAVAFAEALVSVARLGAAPRLSPLHTALLANDRDLSERVDRLLQLQPLAPQPRLRPRTLLFGSGLGMAACAAAVLAWPGTLSSVHKLLEFFLR
jgi:beta-lactamase regulating signal transducer with metallopeptidase domain